MSISFKASGQKANRYYINANLVINNELWNMISKHLGQVVVVKVILIGKVAGFLQSIPKGVSQIVLVYKMTSSLGLNLGCGKYDISSSCNLI